MNNIYDLIIIGGGAAGLTAGIYAGRQRADALLITKNFGGQITKKSVLIENYPGFESISGFDLIEKMENHLKKQPIDIKIDSVMNLKKEGLNFIALTENKNQFEAKAVIVASGADPRLLEIPGEKEFIGKGVSYCPMCDGPLFSKKDVAIVGGGNAGFEVALFLSNIVNKIYILEYSEEPKADKVNQEKVAKIKKVEVITNAVAEEIKGDKLVNSLIYQNRVSKKEKKLEVSGIFVEIGLQPATSFVKDLVDFNERDEIKVDLETLQTKTPGLFAAGDINMGRVKQIVTAAGEGALAAVSAYQYLKSLE